MHTSDFMLFDFTICVYYTIIYTLNVQSLCILCIAIMRHMCYTLIKLKDRRQKPKALKPTTSKVAYVVARD